MDLDNSLAWVTQKLIRPVRLSLKGITWVGGDQRDAHKVRGWGKLMFPAGSYLVWEGGLHGDLQWVIARAGVGGRVRRHSPRRMLIDRLIP